MRIITAVVDAIRRRRHLRLLRRREQAARDMEDRVTRMARECRSRLNRP